MNSPREYSAFVSYASEDRDKAEEICASLEARGAVCWIAPRNVRAGREYADEIIAGLERSACVVLVLSGAANASMFVRREVERAVSKQKRVVPVRIAEVTPTAGLELFISGTQWLDAWTGDWSDHMDRLSRELADGSVRRPVSGESSEDSTVSERRSFGLVYAVLGLVALVAVSGIAIWPTGEAPRQVEAPPAPDNGQKPPDAQNSPSTIVRDQPEQGVAPATGVAGSRPSIGGAGTPPSRESRAQQTSQETAPSVTDPPPLAVEAARELNALRDDYDGLSIRGGAIDDTLNQLWEDMKPASPRVDMATRQRSLKTNLTRSQDALAAKDAAGARRYLENARADLEALERFLNR